MRNRITNFLNANPNTVDLSLASEVVDDTQPNIVALYSAMGIKRVPRILLLGPGDTISEVIAAKFLNQEIKVSAIGRDPLHPARTFGCQNLQPLLVDFIQADYLYKEQLLTAYPNLNEVKLVVARHPDIFFINGHEQNVRTGLSLWAKWAQTKKIPFVYTTHTAREATTLKKKLVTFQ